MASFSEDQFTRLISTLSSSSSSRHSTLASCIHHYDGTKDVGVVTRFLSAVDTYIMVEKIPEKEAIMGLPLILVGEAGIWWQGIKHEVETWEGFKERLHAAFAPRKEAYQLLREIMSNEQSKSMLTETFVAQKRVLFAQLPTPKIPEIRQLDMVYGLLRLDMRSAVPRSAVSSFDNLVQLARAAENIMKERNEPLTTSASESKRERFARGKERCEFCRAIGHDMASCRRRQKALGAMAVPKQEAVTQAPSPSQPRFYCYGCGAPGVVRFKCSTCNKKRPVETGACSIDIQLDVRPRPMVFTKIGDIEECAKLDCCAKSSVASYQLATKLRKKGYVFQQQRMKITLADGIGKRQNVEIVRAPVELYGKTTYTTFVVLPGCKKNQTLLGVGYIQDAGILINLPQFTMSFIERPEEDYDLYDEGFATFKQPSMEEFQMQSPVSVLTWNSSSTLPGNVCASPSLPSCSSPSLPEPADKGTEVSGFMMTTETPVERTIIAPRTPDWNLIPIKSPSPKKSRFYEASSPDLDYMIRDAQINVHSQAVELTLREQGLFDGELDWDVGIDAVDVHIPEDLPENQQKAFEDLLLEYEDVFTSKGEAVVDVEHRIITKDHPPIASPPYRLSPPRREILKAEIDKMLQGGIIEPCSSPWASPVVMVPKKNGEVRICVDYRRLNAITVPDSYPIPRIDDLLHEAKPTPYMSALDLKAGYWQVLVAEADRDKTSFITPFGIYRYIRMPFGLRNAPATFQRMIDRFRVSLEGIKMLGYLDDLIVFSTTFQTHLADLRKIFQRMREYNLTINKDKCRFFASSIKYLGHLITPEGLKADPEKVTTITNLPSPKNLTHLVTFLQTCSWYRRFIENFATVAEPLTRLTKKSAAWTWTEEQENAFTELKHRLTSSPILRQADHTKPYILKTDASNYALGAALVQGREAKNMW
ncbi:uncharacterized protein LOC125236128 [Leguminivora glycinivorella]|uniref:uncharacterized protein LOC125236128 n=1 Tax=Leguminivora glycinivorella TaxID=1035111 RepID=UPI00200D61FC|nr:uncharacterized protein LOC125236128 [Leguminivora glycinivorella]